MSFENKDGANGHMRQKSSKKQIILPQINNCGGDLQKKWYIFFSYRNPHTGKMVRFRPNTGINEFLDFETRMDAAQKLKRKYTDRLKAGWSPFDNTEVIYEDSLEYVAAAEKYGRLKKGKHKLLVLMSDFLDEKKPTSKKKTFQKYQTIFRIFANWLKSNKMESLHPTAFSENDAKNYFKYLLEKRKASPSTYNKNKIVLKTFFAYAVKNNKAIKNPIESIVALHDSPRIAKFYNDKMTVAITTYLASNDLQLLIAVKFIYYTFIRPGELRLLKIKNIDFWNNTITIPREVSKNSKEQKITIPDVFLEELSQMKWNEYPRDYYLFSATGFPGEHPVGQNYFSRRYREYMNAMGISSDYELYSWKHTGAAVAIKQGIDAETIRQQMRHHDLKITQIYLQGLNASQTSDFKTKHKKI